MYNEISKILLQWYSQNKRDLPWRRSSDPYKIWLSEILLQQTRVQQGLPYYHKFIESFPNVKSMAIASEQEILALWQGLGYYSRARNMHKAAQLIVKELNGQFPNTYKELKQLPGVGDYTAAAIGSFAFSESVPVLDGNVFRVISRLFDISVPIDKPKSRAIFKELLNEMIPLQDPGTFNQAIMEFGALQCKPKPVCSSCPLVTYCQAYKNKTIQNRPVKSLKKTVKELNLHYLLIRENDSIWLHHRDDKSIWANMYELPLISEPEIPLLNDSHLEFLGKRVHKLSHRRIMAYFYEGKKTNVTDNTELVKVKIAELKNYPMPVLINDFLINLGFEFK